MLEVAKNKGPSRAFLRSICYLCLKRIEEASWLLAIHAELLQSPRVATGIFPIIIPVLIQHDFPRFLNGKMNNARGLDLRHKMLDFCGEFIWKV